MKITVAEYLGLITAFILLAALAVLLQLGVFTTTILLAVLPSAYLCWRLRPPVRLLVVVAILAIGSTLIWEAVAAANGLWYPLTDLPWRIFGVIPGELFLWSVAFNWFIILLYEHFVDDRWLDAPQNARHLRWLVYFAVATLLVGVVATTMLQGVVVAHAFAWLLLITTVLLALTAALSHDTTRQLISKAAVAALLLIPFFFIHELVALFNTHIIYANPEQYLYAVPLLGNNFPLEKIALYFLVPFWLVLVYELYLDDGR